MLTSLESRSNLFILFSISKNIQNGRHDVIIADYSKWFTLLEILYNIASGVHTHIMLFSQWSKIQYGRYGSHFDFFPKICDDYSSRTTSDRDMGFSLKGSVSVEMPKPVYRYIWMSWVMLCYFRFRKKSKMAAMTS